MALAFDLTFGSIESLLFVNKLNKINTRKMGELICFNIEFSC